MRKRWEESHWRGLSGGVTLWAAGTQSCQAPSKRLHSPSKGQGSWGIYPHPVQLLGELALEECASHHF